MASLSEHNQFLSQLLTEGFQAPVIEIPTPERVTPADVGIWLGEKKPAFMAALMVFGAKMGFGYEKPLSDDLRRLMEKSGCSTYELREDAEPDPQNFTGDTICAYAAAAIEVGIRQKFNDDVVATCVQFETRVNEDDRDKPFIGGHLTPVWGDPNSDDPSKWYFADATYRQFNWDTPPGEILIDRYDKHPNYYHYEEIYRSFLQTYPEPIARMCKPRSLPPGTMHIDILQRLQSGEDPGVSTEDFQSLVDALIK